MNGRATATISGGMTAFNGANFTRVSGSLIPASANFVNTSCGNGGTIRISGLSHRDNFSYDVVDSKNCPVTISGIYAGPNHSSFSYGQAVYCANDADPSPTLAANSTAEGVYSSTPAGLSLNTTNDVVDLSNSITGDYTVNYTTVGSFGNVKYMVSKGGFSSSPLSIFKPNMNIWVLSFSNLKAKFYIWRCLCLSLYF